MIQEYPKADLLKKESHDILFKNNNHSAAIRAYSNDQSDDNHLDTDSTDVNNVAAKALISIDQISIAIFNQVPDEEIFYMLNQLNSIHINAFNSKGQTLLYTASRAGRLEIVKKLVAIKGIKLGGAQNIPLKSTPLHGANWGGHIEVIAILLSLGAIPEENCVTPDGRGLPPSEEANPDLQESLLEKLQLLWEEYSDQGINGISKYLPIGWTLPNPKSELSPNSKVPDVIDLAIGGSHPVPLNGESNGSTVTMLTSSTSSLMTPNHHDSKIVDFHLRANRPYLQTHPASAKSKSLVELKKSHLTTSQSSLSLSQSSQGSFPDIIPNFDIVLKYPPQYKRFPYLFYWKDGKDNLHLYDLITTSKLNNAYARKVTIVKASIKGKGYEINLDTMYHSALGDNKKKKVRNVGMYPRIPQWYWRDDDGTVRGYDEKINLEIWRRKLQGKNTLRIIIGKWSYEIFIKEKIQKNIKTNTERLLWAEEDLYNTQRWWEPQIPLERSNGKKVELVSIEPYSQEWEQVTQLFHLTMPSKVRSGVLDRVSGKSGKFKDCHAVVKIEKIVNPTLREHWEHELQMLKKNHSFNDPNTEYVKLLFHGTSKTPPKIIYEADKGWKISYSRDDSLWGRGLYFAQDSIYTHNYSYKTSENTRKVFLAEVIVGDSIHLEADSNLRQPPLKDEDQNIRYDSVIGLRHDTWIWITYDDARAYPTYLIEYTSNK